MMVIKHSVKESSIHGLGVFAEENVRKGQVVWKQNPMVELTYDQQQWQELEEGLAPACFEQIRKYSYKRNGTYYLCIDNSQFMNHSEEKCNITSDNVNNVCSASRDIKAGEEIICNYYEYTDPDDYNIQIINQFKLATGKQAALKK